MNSYIDNLKRKFLGIFLHYEVFSVEMNLIQEKNYKYKAFPLQLPNCFGIETQPPFDYVPTGSICQ